MGTAVSYNDSRVAILAGGCGHHDLCTKQPVLVQHRAEDGGKIGAFFGRWMTARGLAGPWSSPAYFTVVAGGWAAPAGPLKDLRVPELERLNRELRRAA